MERRHVEVALHGVGLMQVAAIIYGEASGIVRRVVVAEDLKRLEAPTVLGRGENLIILNPDEVIKDGYPDLVRAYALVEAKTGKPSESARCIIVNDKGEIEQAIMADPALDTVGDRKALYQHPEATVDWKIDPDTGEFEKPIEVVEVPVEPIADAKVRK